MNTADKDSLGNKDSTETQPCERAHHEMDFAALRVNPHAQASCRSGLMDKQPCLVVFCWTK